MRIVKPSVELINPPDYQDVIDLIEIAGRVCYKSEDKITPESGEKFISKIIERRHEAVIEHASVSVRFVCDRGVSHEIVRHRLASYCQESTRYCNYSLDKFGTEITVIEPCFFVPGSKAYDDWKYACETAESVYFQLLDEGCSPQEARSVLPNSLKTELIMTANMREWRHFLALRTGKAAHPQMRELAFQLGVQLANKYPCIFG